MDEQTSKKLGRNADLKASGGGSMSETQSDITVEQAKFFDAILHKTPKGQNVLEELSGSKVTYAGQQTIKRAAPGTKQKQSSQKAKL